MSDLPTVACVIYTYHGNRQKIQETFDTWGRYCDMFEAYSDETWEYSPGRETVPLRTYPAPKRDLWNDVRKIWQNLADRYSNGTITADFVTFCGDDAFWILPSLKRYLSTFPANQRLLLGSVASARRKSRNPWVSGAGYVVSRRLIEERVLASCRPTMSEAEDVLTSTCLYRNKVNFTDTRDSLGHSRFCSRTPYNPCSDKLDTILRPSKEVVLFHYTEGELRMNLSEYFQNQTRDFYNDTSFLETYPGTMVII